MSTGKVKFFNKAKGYGFIIPDDVKEPELFFHCTKVQGSVNDNDVVSFDLESTKKGVQAINVKK